MTIPEILAQFQSQGIDRAGEIFFPLFVVVEILKRSENVDIAVIGIEGFIVSEGVVRPQLDLIGDCGDVATDDWELMKRIARQCVARVVTAAMERENIHFALEFMSHDEWAGRSRV
jgi:hypothetical protein